MTDREKTIKRLEHLSEWLFHLYQVVCDGDAPDYYDAYKTVDDAIDLLKEQPDIVRCKDCKNWIAGYITDQDDFIPSKCGKYQQMVGHSSDDFCSLAERREKND